MRRISYNSTFGLWITCLKLVSGGICIRETQTYGFEYLWHTHKYQFAVSLRYFILRESEKDCFKWRFKREIDSIFNIWE